MSAHWICAKCMANKLWIPISDRGTWWHPAGLCDFCGKRDNICSVDDLQKIREEEKRKGEPNDDL